MKQKPAKPEKKSRITGLIQETSNAYTLYHESGYANGDYADFATLSIEEFQGLLRDPNLTRRRLSKLLRRGTSEHRNHAPASCWATYLADYISEVSNTPIKKPLKRH